MGGVVMRIDDLRDLGLLARLDLCELQDKTCQMYVFALYRVNVTLD